MKFDVLCLLVTIVVNLPGQVLSALVAMNVGKKRWTVSKPSAADSYYDLLEELLKRSQRSVQISQKILSAEFYHSTTLEVLYILKVGGIVLNNSPIGQDYDQIDAVEIFVDPGTTSGLDILPSFSNIKDRLSEACRIFSNNEDNRILDEADCEGRKTLKVVLICAAIVILIILASVGLVVYRRLASSAQRKKNEEQYAAYLEQEYAEYLELVRLS